MSENRKVGRHRATVLHASVAALALFAFAGSATAQDTSTAAEPDGAANRQTAANTSDKGALADIVVTARRVDENLQTVPISVGVVSKAELVSRNINDFQGLKGSVVGLTTSRTGTTGGGYVTIRGLTPVATPQPASDQGVGFFIDGVAIARSQGAGSPLVDIARVEVLRGPQGTLFGRNSSIGSINFITNAPVNRFEMSGSAEYGNYNAFRADAILNVPLTSTLIARFAYRHEQADGDVTNTTTTPGHTYAAPYGGFTPASRYDDARSNSYLFKLRFTGIDGLTLDYKYDREDSNQSPGSAQLIGFAPTSPLLGLLAGLFPFQAPGAVVQSFTRLSSVNEDDAGVAKIQNDGHQLNADLRLSDAVSLRSITAYRRTKSNSFADLDGGAWTIPFPFPLAPGVVLPAGPLCVSCSVNVMDQHAFSEEAQVLAKFGKSDVVLGAYYFDEHARFQNTYSVFARVPYSPAVYAPSSTGVVLPLGTPADQVLGNNGIYDNKSVALYAHLDQKFSDMFDISLGGRYTWDDRRTNDLRPGGTIGTLSDGRFTYDAAINLHVDNTKMFFLKYAIGYTSGGIDSNVRFRPEINRQIELGFKGEFLDRKLRFNASGYYSRVRDRQNTLPNTSSGAACNPVLLAAGFTAGNCPVGLFVYNLPGITTVKGFEVETMFRPVHSLTLGANFSYNDPKFSTGELQRAPKTNFSFSTQYDAPAFSNGSHVVLRFDGDYRSKYYATGGNVDAAYVGTVPAALRGGLSNNDYIAALKKAATAGDYWLVNGRIALVDIPINKAKFELAAFVRNLTDTRAALFTVNLGATYNATYERPRTYGVRAAFSF